MQKTVNNEMLARTKSEREADKATAGLRGLARRLDVWFERVLVQMHTPQAAPLDVAQSARAAVGYGVFHMFPFYSMLLLM